MSVSQALSVDNAMVGQATVRQIIEQYFACLNQQQFGQMASLFAADGKMYPPFEGAVVGTEAIERYLKKSASDMSANPQRWEIAPAENGYWHIDVTGKVKAIVFKVNVNWQFEITPAGEIAAAKIKLLASPKELLNLRSVAPQK